MQSASSTAPVEWAKQEYIEIVLNNNRRKSENNFHIQRHTTALNLCEILKEISYFNYLEHIKI